MLFSRKIALKLNGKEEKRNPFCFLFYKSRSKTLGGMMSYSFRRLFGMWALSTMLFSNLAAAEDTTTNGTVGYERGIFLNSGSGNYGLHINGRLQSRAQWEYLNKTHNSSFSIPQARLTFRGHAIDPRFGYAVQLGMDRGAFKLVDFSVNFAVMPYDMQLKVGHFLGGYSWLELPTGAGLEFVDRSLPYRDFSIGPVTGISFHNGKKRSFNWNIGIYENGESRISQKRLAAASASVAYNHNNLDSSTEADLEGGPFRILATLGGFGRAQIDDRKLVGYAASLGAIAKCYNSSISAGVFLGTPETIPAPAGQSTFSKENVKIDALGQAGYVFAKHYGLAARYALLTGLANAPLNHELMGSASVYLYNQELKVQLDGGATITKEATSPLVRAQLQFAF